MPTLKETYGTSGALSLKDRYGAGQPSLKEQYGASPPDMAAPRLEANQPALDIPGPQIPQQPADVTGVDPSFAFADRSPRAPLTIGQGSQDVVQEGGFPSFQPVRKLREFADDALTGLGRFGRTVESGTEQAITAVDEFFGTPVPEFVPVGNELARVLEVDAGRRLITTDKGTVPMTTAQIKFHKNDALGQLVGETGRTAGRYGLGAAGFIGSLPKFADPEELVPDLQPGESAALEVLKQEASGLGEMLAALPIGTQAAISRQLFPGKDPSEPLSPFNPLNALTGAAKVLTGFQDIDQQRFRELTAAGQIAPELPLFAGQLLAGGAKGARNLGRRTGLVAKAPASLGVALRRGAAIDAIREQAKTELIRSEQIQQIGRRPQLEETPIQKDIRLGTTSRGGLSARESAKAFRTPTEAPPRVPADLPDARVKQGLAEQPAQPVARQRPVAPVTEPTKAPVPKVPVEKPVTKPPVPTPEQAAKIVRPGNILKTGGAVAATYAGYDALTTDERRSLALLGIPLASLIRNPKAFLRAKKSKKLPLAEVAAEQAVQSLRKVDISGLKAYHERISAPGGLRPGIKATPEDIRFVKREAAKSLGIELKELPDGRLQAPAGWGKRLSKAMELEHTRLKMQSARDAGIAIRLTKGGKPVPNVRRSGVAVDVNFAEYKGFKDVEPGMFGGTKDITRMIQEMDGSLSAEQKVGFSGQAGPAEQNILWRTRDLVKARSDFMAEQTVVLKKIVGDISKENEVVLTDLLKEMSNRSSYADPAKLIKQARFKSLTDDPAMIKRAQELRRWYDTMRVRQNEMRELRGQKSIGRIESYSPETLQRLTVWEKVYGLRHDIKDVMGAAQLPDYIVPETAFNPHALAREGGIPKWMQERNARVLSERYATAAANDMFHTEIIQNNKAFADQFEAMGFNKNANFLRDYTSEIYGGIKSKGDRWINARPTIRKALAHYRKARALATFPLNLAWNAVVQPSSGVLTVARYGIKNSFKGMVDWATNPSLRREIQKNAYSYRVKNERTSRITHQDIYSGNVSRVTVKRNKLETAVDWANFVTDMTERHLTGWSIASALEKGKQIGLKDQALWEYASDGGAKTQSMYNQADLPGILRNEMVRTVAPFQTFSFELFNTMRELRGSTGMSLGTWKQRSGFVLRLLAGATAVNYMGQNLTGREPWEAKSFIPFWEILAEPIKAAVMGKEYRGGGRTPISPVAAGVDLGRGINSYMRTGNTTKLRKASLRHLPGLLGIPAGVQASRMVDGIIATAKGGEFTSLERMKFPVSGSKEQIRAILTGPYSTDAGQAYLDNPRESNLKDFVVNGVRRKIEYVQAFGEKEGAETLRKRDLTKARNMLRSGRFTEATKLVREWNAVYDNTELQIPDIGELYIEVQKAEAAQERKLLKKLGKGK